MRFFSGMFLKEFDKLPGCGRDCFPVFYCQNDIGAKSGLGMSCCDLIRSFASIRLPVKSMKKIIAY